MLTDGVSCLDTQNMADPLHNCSDEAKQAMVECSHRDPDCLAEFQANQAAAQNSSGGTEATPAPTAEQDAGTPAPTAEQEAPTTPVNPCADYNQSCAGQLIAANPDETNVVGKIQTNNAPISWGMFLLNCQADADAACKAQIEAQGGFRKLALHCGASLTEAACATELGVLTNVQDPPEAVTDDLVACGVTNAVETEDAACLTAYDEVRTAEPDYLADEAADIQTLRDEKAAEKEKAAADKAAADDDSSSATLLVGSLLSILPVFYALW